MQTNCKSREVWKFLFRFFVFYVMLFWLVNSHFAPESTTLRSSRDNLKGKLSTGHRDNCDFDGESSKRKLKWIDNHIESWTKQIFRMIRYCYYTNLNNFFGITSTTTQIWLNIWYHKQSTLIIIIALFLFYTNGSFIIQSIDIVLPPFELKHRYIYNLNRRASDSLFSTFTATTLKILKLWIQFSLNLSSQSQ